MKRFAALLLAVFLLAAMPHCAEAQKQLRIVDGKLVFDGPFGIGDITQVDTSGSTHTHVSDDAFGGENWYYKERATGKTASDNDSIWSLNFMAYNDNATPEPFSAAWISFDVLDSTEDTEDGRISFGAVENGGGLNGLTLQGRKFGVADTSPEYTLDVGGPIALTELSADPADPAEGKMVMWMSDGTGAGDDGDILIKITAGGSTKTVTLVDFTPP